jgi:methionyl-tRNA formyltransferase
LTTSCWRIVFFGTPVFAVPALKALLEGPDEIIAAVTQPDRKKGRGQRISFSPVKETVLQYTAASFLPFKGRAREGMGSDTKAQEILLFQPEKVKEEAFQESLRGLHPDLFVVAAYGQILPKSLLDIPQHGAINVHASLLPKYRGAAPIAWAILKGEASTGVTIIQMDQGMDTGDILLQKEIPIGAGETSETLHDKLASLGARLLMEALAKIKGGEISPLRQDPSLATYAPLLKKDDGRIDWRREAREIDRQVRAFDPWPGAYTLLEGQLLKIFKGEVREGKPGEPAGKVLWTGMGFVEVGAGRGSFVIREVQLEGKKRMSIRDFLAGHPIPVGTVVQ